MTGIHQKHENKQFDLQPDIDKTSLQDKYTKQVCKHEINALEFVRTEYLITHTYRAYEKIAHNNIIAVSVVAR